MSELPKGWVGSTIGEACLIENGLRKPISLKERAGCQGDFPYYGATGVIDYLNSYTHEGEYVLIGEDGANLLSKSKPLAFIANGKYWVNNHAHTLRCLADSPNLYLEKYFNSLSLESWVTGSAQPKLTKKNLESIPYPIAPLAEQKRIVEKLDEVLAQVDTIKARLDGIPAILKRFRQSVLASAVSGKLTEEWRGISCLGSVSGMVETVVKNNPHKAKPYEPSVPKYPIDPTWKWCRLGDIITLKSGKTIKASEEKEEGTIPYYKVGDMNAPENQFYMNKVDKFVGDSISKKSLLPANTIIFPKRGGAIGTNKKRILSIESLVDLNTMGIIVPDEFEMKYFYRWFETIDLASLNTGSTIPQVNNGDIEPLWIPVPPVEEQKEIVRLVDQYFAFAETIEAQVKKAQARVDNLTQSILAKAFRGELVPQDPNDEPAEKLLERIALARKESEALAKAAKKAQSTKSTAKKKVAKSV